MTESISFLIYLHLMSPILVTCYVFCWHSFNSCMSLNSRNKNKKWRHFKAIDSVFKSLISLWQGIFVLFWHEGRKKKLRICLRHDMEYHISYIIIKINYCKQFLLAVFKAQRKMLETTIERNNGANYMHNRKKKFFFCFLFVKVFYFYDLFF